MKKFLSVLIIVFICGVLSADICFTQIKDSDVIIGKEFYEQYANSKLSFRDVFWNVLYERVKLLGMMLLLCFTPLKEKVGILLLPTFSFVWGVFLYFPTGLFKTDQFFCGIIDWIFHIMCSNSSYYENCQCEKNVGQNSWFLISGSGNFEYCYHRPY